MSAARHFVLACTLTWKGRCSSFWKRAATEILWLSNAAHLSVGYEIQEWLCFCADVVKLSRQPSQFTHASVTKLPRRYNRLYTLTAQTKEADFGGTKDTLQQVLGSFKPPVPVI